MKRDWTEPRRKVDAEGRCRACRTTHSLQAAHIIPRSRIKPGPAEDPRNIVPLCAACHERQHRNELEVLSVLSLAEQAYAVELVGLAEAYRRLCPQRR